MFILLFTECSVAASVKKPSSTNSSQDCPTTQQGEGCTLGLTKEQLTDSCYHIYIHLQPTETVEDVLDTQWAHGGGGSSPVLL